MTTDETAARLGDMLANGDLPKLAYKPFEFDDWGTVRVLPKSDDGFTDHFCQVRWPWADDDEKSRHRIEKTDPWGSSAKALCLAVNVLPALLAEREAMKAELTSLRIMKATLGADMVTCPLCEGRRLAPSEFCYAGCSEGKVLQTTANVLQNVIPVFDECSRMQSELTTLRAAQQWRGIESAGEDGSVVGIKGCHLNYLVALADFCAGEGLCGPNIEMEPDEWCAAAWERYGPENGDYSSQSLACAMAEAYQQQPLPPGDGQ